MRLAALAVTDAIPSSHVQFPLSFPVGGDAEKWNPLVTEACDDTVIQRETNSPHILSLPSRALLFSNANGKKREKERGK